MAKWLKITILSFLVLANVAVLGLVWVLNTGEDVLASADTDEEVTKVLSEAPGDDLTFLIVGSDSREGLDDLSNFGAFGGERGDVIMLMRVDPSTGGARMLSIPRDLYVDIPGHGKGKINAAFAFGGPSLMVQTIRQNLGIDVNHYVEVGFVGFEAMIDELDGIEMFFPNPARDLSSGLDVPAGQQKLGGDMALAYARSRKYQELQGGSWVSVEANDIGRTKRQQEIVRAIISELKTPGTITEAGQIASSLAEHMTIDSALASSSAANLAWDLRGIISGSIGGSTLPVDGATVGGASVVVAREPEASRMIAEFLAGGEVAEGPLRLQVLNGNGVTGAASRMSESLDSSGFEIADVGDAGRADYRTTTIVVPDGSDAGQAIIAELGFGVVEFGDVDNGYDAVVIVGADAA